MLVNLHVKNLAIIDEVEVDFSEHMNVLTGETGAGKSIIIGSINLALGGKFSGDMIRNGAESALVELLFSVEKPEEKQALEALGVLPEEDTVLISRKLMPKRSVCRVNGETVTQSALREIAGVLIDIHGQNEQQSLLHTSKHMQILDRYGREELSGLLSEFQAGFQEYRKIEQELNEREVPEEERLREISFLQYELEEITQAKLRAGEEEELEEEYKRLSNATAIAEELGEVHRLTSAGNMAASEQIGQGLRALLKVAEYDEKIQNFSSQLSDIDSLLTDFNRDVSTYMDDFVVDPQAQQEVEKRLDQIRSIQAKYGSTVEKVQEYAEQVQEKLKKYEEYDTYREGLLQQQQQLQSKLDDLAEKVTKLRQSYGAVLEEKIKEALIDLNFLQVEFHIDVRQLEEYSMQGLDEVEFMISTNPGEPMRPIGSAASGGELSRIMLAVKAVLAEHDEISTLIFDEIDVGISGRTAQKVAEKMALIGAGHQVICISHLAQIAAMADTHYLIEKKNEQSHTATDIYPLSAEESVTELARILGGAQITEAVRESAREMKALADEEKQKLRAI
ncbi:MAG: DNA repair protein RecN [Lachnospiraceae bacterium]|nr:DNA repair protein RecN [Lachnospiraceae bacterium]